MLRLVEDAFRQHVPEVAGLPIIGLSALTGAGAEDLMPAVLAAHGLWTQRVPTARLNNWLAKVTLRRLDGSRSAGLASYRRSALVFRASPPLTSLLLLCQVVGSYIGTGSSNEVSRVRYITQVKARPPTFAVFTKAASISERTQKFLMNAIRQEFTFQGVPIRLVIRRKLRSASKP